MIEPDDFFDWLDGLPSVVLGGMQVLTVITVVVINVLSTLAFLRLIGAL